MSKKNELPERPDQEVCKNCGTCPTCGRGPNTLTIRTIWINPYPNSTYPAYWNWNTTGGSNPSGNYTLTHG